GEHVVDHDLERPRLRELQGTDGEDLHDRPDEQARVGSEPAKDLPEKADGAAHRRQRVTGGSEVPIGRSPIRRATMSSVSLRMRPRRKVSAAMTARFTIPSARPTALISGTRQRS